MTPRQRFPLSLRLLAPAIIISLAPACSSGDEPASAPREENKEQAKAVDVTSTTGDEPASVPREENKEQADAVDVTSTTAVNRQERTDLRGARYCEMMLVSKGSEGFEGVVYTTQGLNECPQEQWEALNFADIAKETGALFAVPNGPRHLTLDSVSIVLADDPARMTFGEIEMTEVALVKIGDELTTWPTYAERSVARDTVFSFNRGSEVYELVNPDGTRYVMQSRSLIVDPTLNEASLAGLGGRLMLPDGWTFEVRTLEEDLDVLDTDGIATVVQDELLNTYQRIDRQ
jgi:hypothetical protein